MNLFRKIDDTPTIFVKVNLLYFQCDVKSCILCLITSVKVSLRVFHRLRINISSSIKLHFMEAFFFCRYISKLIGFRFLFQVSVELILISFHNTTEDYSNEILHR
jgi:hypothetical protein